MSESPAEIISHYQILRRLARGGMSQIYLAKDIHTNSQANDYTNNQTEQLVAIKLVHSDYDDHCKRFRREVQALTRLKHKHILPVLEYGEDEPWCYLVSPYIEYGTLTSRLSHGPMTPEEAGRLLAQIASALHYTHTQGILHRDIKPTNILLEHGQHVYLADFGLAQQAGASNGITQTDLLIGTAEYMAPELADRPATAGSDIYALGILLYQMLTGRVPFSASTPVATFLKQIYEHAQPPSLLNPALPPDIDDVILRALHKDPQARFASAADLTRAYQEALPTPTSNQTSRDQDHTSLGKYGIFSLSAKQAT
jgi:serine/threonine protein kinase